MKRVTAIVLAATAVCLMSLSAAEQTAGDPNAPDTVYIDSVAVNIPDNASVAVSFFNDEYLDGIEVTLQVLCPAYTIDSFSFEGTRLPNGCLNGWSIHEGALTAFSYPVGSDLIPAGSGLLGLLFVSCHGSVQPEIILIDSATVHSEDTLIEYTTAFSDTLSPGSFVPVIKPGCLDLQRCCVGKTGNANCDPEERVNLSDITKLIERVYISMEPLCCEAEGNTNGSLDNRLSLGDITLLIDHVYVTGRETAACP